MKHIKKIFTLLVLSYLSFAVFASTGDIDKTNPYKMIKEAADNAFKRFSREQTAIKKDPNILKTIVREELLPYVDYRYAAYKVIGSGNLRKTTRAQRDKFVIIFRDYLVTQYAQVFTRYNKQKVIFDTEKDFADKKILGIKTTIVDPKLGMIDIVFKVRKNKRTKQWKAFDLVAEGVSLLDSKRAELSSIIQQKGIDYAGELLEKKALHDIKLESSKPQLKKPKVINTKANKQV
jgi:phospholipid transport system substrate-binding protein